MIWRSSTALLSSDHRCGQEGNERLKHTFQPGPGFHGFWFGVAHHEVTVCARALPPPPPLQGPWGPQHPPRSSSAGGRSYRGSPRGRPSAAPRSRLRAETGRRAPGRCSWAAPALRGAARAAGPVGLSRSAPDGPAHPPRGLFTPAPTFRARAEEVGLTLTALPAPTPGGARRRLAGGPFFGRGRCLQQGSGDSGSAGSPAAR